MLKKSKSWKGKRINFIVDIMFHYYKHYKEKHVEPSPVEQAYVQVWNQTGIIFFLSLTSQTQSVTSSLTMISHDWMT